MLIAVDGSSDSFGAQSDIEYDREYRNSFVREIYVTSRHQHKQYFHGPDLLSMGREVVRISGVVVDYIRHTMETTGDRTIVMAGHSRGGAVCIHAALRLQRESWSAHLTVRCIALFDAVGRDIATDTTLIPQNVERAYHAMRHPDSGSRPSFGNE
jgi:pimeloyl-ACP methyl ester carboxylesterase